MKLDTENLNHLYSEFISVWQAAQQGLLLLDYDGTLVNFAPLPDSPVPDAELLKLMAGLARRSDLAVVIISGRGKDSLERWFGHLPIRLVAEHGALIRTTAGWHNRVGGSISWSSSVYQLLGAAVEQVPGSFIEKKDTSINFHYRAALNPTRAKVAAQTLAAQLENATKNQGYSILDGEKIIELRQGELDKGTVALELIDEFHGSAVLAAGDGRTDEDMFKVLPPAAVSIKVGVDPGQPPTAARFFVANPDELKGLLRRIAGYVNTV